MWLSSIPSECTTNLWHMCHFLSLNTFVSQFDKFRFTRLMAAPQHSSSELGSAFGLHINFDLSICYFIRQRIRRPSCHIVSRIEAMDGLQVIIREGKVEKIYVFLHPLLVGGLWNGDDAVLYEELQCYLCSCLAIFFRQ